MQSPKVVVIGAGSHFFGRAAIWQMVESEILRNGTLALVDTDPDVLDTMMKLGDRAIKATGVPTQLIGSTDRREVLQDADFVVLTFSEANAYYRGVDAEVSIKHGIRLCSADTIGPGGIFRSLREVPRALEMADDIAELAPYSWTINFVNPTSVLGIALMRYAPHIRSFALCDGLHEPYHRLNIAKRIGLISQDATSIPPSVERRFECHVMGVNHFTWMTRLEYEDKDLLPQWRAMLAAEADEEAKDTPPSEDLDAPHPNAKKRYNKAYALQLMDIFDAYPQAVGHTKEYVPYYQGYGAAPTVPEPIAVFHGDDRAKAMSDKWEETKQYANGEKSIETFLANTSRDHATDIIESMWGNLNKPFYINTTNRGAIENMPDDAFLEFRCDLDMNGPRPQSLDPMPRGLLGLQHQVLDSHELTAQAGATCDRNILYRAMMTDPIVNQCEDAKALMAELFEREKDILPSAWYE